MKLLNHVPLILLQVSISLHGDAMRLELDLFNNTPLSQIA